MDQPQPRKPVEPPTNYFIVKVFSFIEIGCMAAMVVITLVVMAGGLKFLEQGTEPSTNLNGQCCTECVESFGKFLAFVIGIPVGILLLGIGILIMVTSVEQVKAAAGSYSSSRLQSFKSKAKAASTYSKKVNVTRILFGAGMFVFALAAFIMTFNSGRLLYNSTDSENNSSTGKLNYTQCQNAGLNWCVSCKPEFWRLFLASGFFGLIVWGAAFGIYIQAQKAKKQEAAELSNFY